MILVKNFYTNSIMDFGKWLVKTRKAAGLSQRKLADRMSEALSYARISQIEKGKIGKKGEPPIPPRSLVLKFADALGCPVEEALIAAGYAAPKNSKELARSVWLPKDVWLALDADALQEHRSPNQQLAALLLSHYKIKEVGLARPINALEESAEGDNRKITKAEPEAEAEFIENIPKDTFDRLSQTEDFKVEK